MNATAVHCNILQWSIDHLRTSKGFPVHGIVSGCYSHPKSPEKNKAVVQETRKVLEQIPGVEE